MITSSPTFGEDLSDTDVVEPDPLALMRRWLPPDTNELRPLMTLSSIDAEGYPDSRSVLVSKVSAAGLHFHTDAGTRKAAQLDGCPKAAAVLAWPDVGRQLVVSGLVERESPAEAAATFAARSSYLRRLAWANTEQTAQLPLAERRARWAALGEARPDEQLQPPPTWIGFLLRPSRLTFWRGDPEGPSNRVEYRLTAEGWTMAKLPG